MTRNAIAVLALSLVTLGGDAAAAAPKANVNPHGKLKQPCDSCHMLDAWKPLR